MFRQLVARLFGRKEKAEKAASVVATMPPPPPPSTSKVVVDAAPVPAPRRLRLIKGGGVTPQAAPVLQELDPPEPSDAPGMTTEPEPVSAAVPEAPTARLTGPKVSLVFGDGSSDEVTDHTPNGMRIRYLADNLISDERAR